MWFSGLIIRNSWRFIFDIFLFISWHRYIFQRCNSMSFGNQQVNSCHHLRSQYDGNSAPCLPIISRHDIVLHRTRSTSDSESAMPFTERLSVLRFLYSSSSNLSVSPARLRLNNIILTRVTITNVSQDSASVSDSNCAWHFLLSAAMYWFSFWMSLVSGIICGLFILLEVRVDIRFI